MWVMGMIGRCFNFVCIRSAALDWQATAGEAPVPGLRHHLGLARRLMKGLARIARWPPPAVPAGRGNNQRPNDLGPWPSFRRELRAERQRGRETFLSQPLLLCTLTLSPTSPTSPHLTVALFLTRIPFTPCGRPSFIDHFRLFVSAPTLAFAFR
jgi:hypothetical protein